MPKREGIKIVAQNRKARHDYFVDGDPSRPVWRCTALRSSRSGRASAT